MKNETSNQEGKTEMKTAQNQVGQRGVEQDSSVPENAMNDNRIQQLMDLAHDGDEIAASELELHYALVS